MIASVGARGKAQGGLTLALRTEPHRSKHGQTSLAVPPKAAVLACLARGDLGSGRTSARREPRGRTTSSVEPRPGWVYLVKRGIGGASPTLRISARCHAPAVVCPASWERASDKRSHSGLVTCAAAAGASHWRPVADGRESSPLCHSCQFARLARCKNCINHVVYADYMVMVRLSLERLFKKSEKKWEEVLTLWGLVVESPFIR